MEPGHQKGLTRVITEMTIIGLQHASATVTNLSRSIEFYSDILGLEYLGTRHMSAEKVYEFFKLQGVSVRYGWFMAGRSAVLELYEFDPAETEPYEFSPNKLGPHHFALQVRNLDAFYRELMKQGVKGVCPPEFIQGGFKVAYISDPDEIVIELIDLGFFLAPKIQIIGKVKGLISRFKKKRERQMAPGACRTTNEK